MTSFAIPRIRKPKSRDISTTFPALASTWIEGPWRRFSPGICISAKLTEERKKLKKDKNPRRISM